MDAIAEAAPRVAIPTWATRRRFDVTEYYRMAEAGIFGEDDPIELIEGEIIEMASVGGPHIGAVMALQELLSIAAAGRFKVSVQNALRLDRRNEPEPDLVLLRHRPDRYFGTVPPQAEDALLVIEVSNSSLQFDREVKAPLYARHGIPELWIVDVTAGAIELFRAAADGSYTEVTRAGRGDTIAPLALPEARIAVADVVPP